ncbi:sodium-dependent transporter [Paenibacillus sp. P26]|nr:sodium-dependent transporter [Paenibacillus sp. P26]
MSQQQAESSVTNKKKGKSERFTSSGFILAAIGDSVGLGNMWKFPYITGKHGGAAFFLVFIICLIVVGSPILLAEMTIGRGGRGNASTALYRLTNKKYWGALGFLPIITAFLVMCYYAVVAGWTLHYTVESFTGSALPSRCGLQREVYRLCGGALAALLAGDRDADLRLGHCQRGFRGHREIQ